MPKSLLFMLLLGISSFGTVLDTDIETVPKQRAVEEEVSTVIKAILISLGCMNLYASYFLLRSLMLLREDTSKTDYSIILDGLTTQDDLLFREAFKHHEWKKVEYMLQNKKLQKNITDESHYNAIHHAVLDGNLEMVKKLADHGVNRMLKSVETGWTPLQLARIKRKDEQNFDTKQEKENRQK